MPSLTSLHPALAPIFGLTEKALYERQNSLVRMKMLPTPIGRGRGSGAEATPENVALLIIAVMATDRQADDDRVRKLASAPFVDGKKDRCLWTGAAVFKDALAFVLSPAAPTTKPGRVVHTDVRVYRNSPAGRLWFAWPKRRDGDSQFGEFYRRRRDRLSVEVELPNDALIEIRRLLNNEGSS